MSRPKLTKAQRTIVDAAVEIIRPWGLSWRVEHPNSGHAKLIVEGPRGLSFRVDVAGTPRDTENEADHVRTRVRRALATMHERAGVFALPGERGGRGRRVGRS